jgi:hypothetical protein
MPSWWFGEPKISGARWLGEPKGLEENNVNPAVVKDWNTWHFTTLDSPPSQSDPIYHVIFVARPIDLTDSTSHFAHAYVVWASYDASGKQLDLKG